LNLFKINIAYHQRVFGLDVMRSIAILIVVFGHSFLLLEPWHGEVLPIANISVGLLMNTLINGFDGVDLFFVLSGFLIGSIFIRIVEKSDGLQPKIILDFWKRRWIRTIPAYLVVLILNLEQYQYQ